MREGRGRGRGGRGGGEGGGGEWGGTVCGKGMGVWSMAPIRRLAIGLIADPLDVEELEVVLEPSRGRVGMS